MALNHLKDFFALYILSHHWSPELPVIWHIRSFRTKTNDRPADLALFLPSLDQAMHDLRVDQWDKWVVIAVQNQRRLPEFAQPEDAGPPHSSQHLIEVAER